MYSKTVVQIINCFALIACEVLFEDLYNIPDYDSPSFQRSKDVRESFIKNRKRNDQTARRITLLDKYLPDNTVYVDDIAHFQIVKNNHSDWKKVKEFETDFRNLIAMRGLKYTYRRDTYWRTWRLVNYPKEAKVICYRYENSVNFKNDHSGYWVSSKK